MEIKRTQNDWDIYFLKLAIKISELSKNNKKAGCVIVSPNRRQLSIGYNGLPADIPDTIENLNDSCFKDQHIIHAEINCISQAPFYLDNCSLYVNMFPCFECAKRILLANISKVICKIPDYNDEKWGNSWKNSMMILIAAEVEIKQFDLNPNFLK